MKEKKNSESLCRKVSAHRICCSNWVWKCRNKDNSTIHMDEADNHSIPITAFGWNHNTAHYFLVPALNMYELLRIST